MNKEKYNFLCVGGMGVFKYIWNTKENKIVRCFSTKENGVNNSINKLVINSNIEQIVFDNGKAVLMLPSLNSITGIYDSNENHVDYDSIFLDDLGKMLGNLDSKLYRLDFYFYIESCLLIKVFKFDSNNKYLLNKVDENFGYFKLISIKIKLDSVWVMELLSIASQLGQALSSINENKEFNANLDKETILVVNKINDTEHSNGSYVKKDFKSVKRMYSTYSKPIGFTGDNIKNTYYDYELINNYDKFRSKMVYIIRPGNKYAFLLKFKRDDGCWGMGGKHISFLFLENYEDILKTLHEELVRIVDNYIEEYHYCGLDLIELMTISLKRLPDLEIENINKIKLDKNLIRIGETKKTFNNLVLPLTMNDYYYGNKLVKNVNTDGIIINVNMDNINIIPLIQENSKLVNKIVNDSLDFYEFINKKQIKHIIVLKRIDNESNQIEVFDKNGNNLVFASDFKMNDGEFKRVIGKFTLTIKDDVITRYQIKDKLPTIKPLNQDIKSSRNTNIGSFDIETYFNHSENKSYVYALGYKTLSGDRKLFYKSECQSSYDLILECINSMLINKYNGFTFFVHNLGGFDVVFILSVIDEYNLKNKDYYTWDPIFRDDRIIKLKVSIKTKSGVISITFVDSFNILNKSLDALGIDFECDQLKGNFCHPFVNESTLYYIGNTPDKDYFKKMDENEYNLIKKQDWNLKEEALKYLGNDLDVLLEIVDKFNKYIFITYDLQITNCLTISRIGVNIIKNKYISPNTKIPLITKPTIFNFVKQGYYGGITEVYKPYVEDANYYDVNSEYPFVSKNKMPGNEYTYIEDMEGKGLNLDELFGFFYCKVKTNNGYLGLLPIHSEGNLVLFNGEFYGVWFSEELKFARDNGYEIKVIKGYNFVGVEGVFEGFVDDLFKIRQNSKGMIKAVTKLILNSPFGRFGMNINKPVHKKVDKDTLDYILSTHEVNSFKKLNSNSFLISYNSEISKSVCERTGLDYIKVIESSKKKNQETSSKAGDVSITTAAAITAYARIYINKIKLWIISNGGELYYSDTDSIVTNIKLPDEMVGSDLGKLKLEHKIKKAYFITSKTYLLELYDGKLIKKAKGVYSDNLDKSDYENMYFKNLDVKATRGDTSIDFEVGTVNIKTKEAILHYNAYTKRQKIYNNNNLWVDTKPIEYYDNKTI